MTELSDMSDIPPHDLAVERAVLGAMLLAPHAAVDEVQRSLARSDDSLWYSEHHHAICNNIIALYNQGTAVDLLTVADQLRAAGMLELVGGPGYLGQLLSEVATAGNIAHHLSILHGLYIHRKLIIMGHAVAQQAYDASVAPVEVVTRSEAMLHDLIDSCHRSSTFISMGQALETHIEHMEQVSSKAGGITGVPSGFVDLDRSTAGWQPGDMVTLAARPSVGKTALSLSFACHAAACGYRTLFFSLEMAYGQLMMRMLSTAHMIPTMRTRRGQLTDEEWSAVAQGCEEMATWPLSFNDQAGLTVGTLRSMARQHHRQHAATDKPLGLIIVDYLQLLHGGVKVNNREQEVAHVSRELKGMAKDLSVPVIALSQLSRAVELRPDKKPQLSDLRDSGELEQNSDLVLFLYRPELYGLKGLNDKDLKGESPSEKYGLSQSQRLVLDTL